MQLITEKKGNISNTRVGEKKNPNLQITSKPSMLSLVDKAATVYVH